MLDQFLELLPTILNTIYISLKKWDAPTPDENIIKRIEHLENLLEEREDELNQLKQDISFIQGHLSK